METGITNLRKWMILLTVSVSIFMATLDGSIVNIALPVISQRLGVDMSAVQWVVTSYLITISALLLIWGKISDIYGKKYIFAAGFILFTIGSALCGFSHSLATLVVFRIAQAVGAGAMMALSQGIVTAVFPPSERGRALGITGMMVAIGSLVGPSLGGILVNAAGWESIFFVNIPVGVAGTVLALTIIPEISERAEDRRFDVPGALLFTAALLLLFVGLLFLQQGLLPLPVFLGMFAAALLSAAGFVFRERRVPNPLLKLGLFRRKEFSSGLLSAYLSFIAMNSTLYFMPFYLQNVLGLSPLTAGLLISVYPITTALVAPLSGALSDRISYRPLTVAGMSAATAALLFISTLSDVPRFAPVAAGLILLGIGVALFQSPNNSSVMGSVPKNELGVAGGINALFRNLGMVSGTTFSVLIFSFMTKLSLDAITGKTAASLSATFMKGFRAVILFDAACTLLAALLNVTRAVAFRPKAKDADND